MLPVFLILCTQLPQVESYYNTELSSMQQLHMIFDDLRDNVQEQDPCWHGFSAKLAWNPEVAKAVPIHLEYLLQECGYNLCSWVENQRRFWCNLQ
jgi:hypothetical protein